MYIEIKGLNFRYRSASEDTIIDFNLTINKGEIVSIFGQSGSGKSTVLRLLAGLETPKSGIISINNKTMVDENIFVLPEKRGLGMVFQDYALFPHLTVERNIKFGMKKMNRVEKNKRAQEVLELVGLTDYEQRYPYELSGGQQQRVALARALAPKPALLLLDEPFSNLDADLHAKIRDELNTILRQAGVTSIFVTHDKTDSLEIADRVVILHKGRKLQEGIPKHVFQGKELSGVSC